MTLLIAIQCKDGLIIQTDTLFKNAENFSKLEGKLFTILDDSKNSIVLTLAGRRDWFDETIELFRETFLPFKEMELTKEKIRELILKCRDKQRRDFFQEMDSENKNSEGGQIPIGGIVSGKLKENDKTEYFVFNYDMQVRPIQNVPLHIVGHGDVEANLILDKIIKSVFNRIKIDWKDLSSKLVSQIVYFTMRFTTMNDATVGGKINGFALNDNGISPYSLEQFFPKTFENLKNTGEKDYLPEFIETIFSELPSQSKEIIFSQFSGLNFND